MRIELQRIIYTSAIFFFASLVAFIVLNRWIFTDIGFLSYGRIWQLYISYTDFGFVRRALLGTIFSESGLNSLFRNEYYFALAIHHIAISALAIIVGYYCISRRISDPIFLASVAFSPALIIHSGYSAGSLDVFVVIIAAINILFVRNIVLFSAIIIFGVLTHELFLFTIPAQLFAIFKQHIRNQTSFSYKILALPTIASALGVFLVTVFGTTDMPKEDVEYIMRHRIPIAAGQHGLWSGYFEIASTVKQNSLMSIQDIFSEFWSGIIFLIIPLMYVGILIARIWSYSEKPIEFTAMAFSTLAPLLTTLVATDHYRWIAMSANMGIFLTLISVSKNGRTASRWNLPLLLFCVLAPFGSAQIDRPFPMHQFIIEKILQ